MTTPTPDDPAVAAALGVLVARPAASDDDLLMALAETEADDLPAAVAAARARFAVGDAHWFRCAGDACRGYVGPPGLGAGSPCTVSDTGCQGLCERAPLGALRVGDRVERFARFASGDADLGAALRRIAGDGHFWGDAAAAVERRIDVIHDPSGSASSSLVGSPVACLAGHFRGTGRYAAREGRFYKELLGSWDANGTLLTLRMAVGFPLRDGRRDGHEALVVIRRDGEGFVGTAYADSGAPREYRYAVEADGTLCFADRPPGHGDAATRARKRLVPDAHGYTERLEVERNGDFVLYSEVPMRRVRH